MTFELFCMGMLALLVGLAVCFNGYRWFLILLPVWGFFFGFGLGAQTLQAVFGVGFVASVTSWVLGFLVGLVFAVLSYLFYFIGVALFAGSFGYALGVGLMGAIGIEFNLLVWVVGIVLGIIVAAVTILLNIQKWVIIFITSFGGAALIVGTIGLLFSGANSPAAMSQNPFRAAIQGSWLLIILFLVVGILGFIGQWRVNQAWVLEAPEDRW
jgi:hypothetical protein